MSQPSQAAGGEPLPLPESVRSHSLTHSQREALSQAGRRHYDDQVTGLSHLQAAVSALDAVATASEDEKLASIQRASAHITTGECPLMNTMP